MTTECPDCGCQEVKLVKTPEILHYGKEECAKCGRWIRWVKTPKEVKHMKIREDFEKVLTDCETRHAINSPVKGADWRNLTMGDYWVRLGGVDAGLLKADTLAETYVAALDCMLILLMLSKKIREDLSWEERFGIMVIQDPIEPEVTTKECEEKS